MLRRRYSVRLSAPLLDSVLNQKTAALHIPLSSCRCRKYSLAALLHASPEDLRVPIRPPVTAGIEFFAEVEDASWRMSSFASCRAVTL